MLRLYERFGHPENVHNTVLFLNLGNAYYRTGSMGRAIHAYRRGMRSGSQDARVIESLEQILKSRVLNYPIGTVQGVRIVSSSSKMRLACSTR